MSDSVLNTIEPWQVWVFKAGVAILPMILLGVAYILVKKYYKIDENRYNEICKELETRRSNVEASNND
ncbi:MAG: hypothetical protein MJ238_02880 [Bacilli bacterium]|nr:hypothetical protein [Bacilli bacterium]